MALPQLEDMHEYLSFEDPDEDRTWVIDVTFLLSSWTCIWGRGCLGVLTGPAAELQQGCCSYGAHFIDEDDLDAVRPYVARLTDDNWQFRGKSKRFGWHRTERDGTLVTRVVEDACIFLNRPGFAGGEGCALHNAAVTAGERPLDWKPDVCWQLPLRLEEETDDHGHITSTLREWKRRDWGDGGFEFHWWCTETHEAFVGRRPVYEELHDEIVEMIGQKVFDLVEPVLKARENRKMVPLPHPAVRRR